MSRPTASDVQRSYHPQGFDASAGLMRARKPFFVRNLITGGAVVTFIVSVYIYSISAVKQDDFSDVVDLLPPPSERKNIRTLEDEEREQRALLGEGITPARPAAALDGTPAVVVDAETPRASVLSYIMPKRLSEVEWVRRTGLVEEGKGNLFVWGAPNVDNIGNMRQAGDSRGRRLV